jgi:hypothetical protein
VPVNWAVNRLFANRLKPVTAFGDRFGLRMKRMSGVVWLGCIGVCTRRSRSVSSGFDPQCNRHFAWTHADADAPCTNSSEDKKKPAAAAPRLSHRALVGVSGRRRALAGARQDGQAVLGKGYISQSNGFIGVAAMGRNPRKRTHNATASVPMTSHNHTRHITPLGDPRRTGRARLRTPSAGKATRQHPRRLALPMPS